MKLSFSLSSKPSSNLRNQQPSSSTTFSANNSSSNPTVKEYVTEFDPSKAPSSSTKQTLIIPPKQNEWRPIKRMKNLGLPDSTATDQPLQFEIDNGGATAEPTVDGISYGLNVRQSENPNPNPNPNANSKQLIDPMLRQFKEDLKRLPDHNGIDEYTDMPVEGYGAALLKGYGWVEGRGIGRNAKEDVKVVEYKKWSAKEGIGFVPEVPKKKGEKCSVKVDNVEKKDRENGSTGLYVGKEVRVVRGKEMGMKGVVLEVKSDGDVVVLKVAKRDDEVKVKVRDVADLGSVEEERCLKKLKELKIREEKSDLDERRSRDEGTIERKKESKRSRDERSDDKVSWLVSHIRVRIISKDLKRGRLYLKKGEIMDVVGPTSCDICMDETRELIQGVDQDLLETALPKRGGPVLVLYGRHKGVYGHLVEKDSENETGIVRDGDICMDETRELIQGVDQDLLETALPKRGGPVLVLYGRHKGVYGHLVEKDSENETGIVRDGDTKELLKVRLEQIAEYLGDPSYIGY